MRLAVNASIYDGRPSGLGAYTWALVHALYAQHAGLTCYTSRARDLPAARPIWTWGEPSRGWRGHAWRLAWSQTALPLRVQAARTDVLLNTVPEGPVRPPVPQVTVVHDILPLFFPREFPRQQWYFRVFVPRVLRASAAVIAVSQRTREDVLQRYGLPPERVTAVYSGVDRGRFFPRADAGDVVRQFGLRRYLLYVGNLLPHKNLERLLDAFSVVPRDVMLAVAGHRDPRYWPALAQRADALKVAGRVRFLGFVPADLLPHLYSGAEAVVLPSLYEGFGLPVLEAMACGAPVVASTAGGLGEAVGDAALNVDPQDVPGLAAALRRVVDDAALRADLRRRGATHVQRFRWEETARRVLSIIREVAR